MNYPVKYAVIHYLRTGNSRVIREVMEMICTNYPKQVIDCLMNILGTHDTMRILTALGSEYYTDDKDIQAEHKLSQGERENGVTLLKMAAVMQFTLPGFPCIYYGDEAGMEGYGPPFSRRFFPWDNIDKELNSFYKKLSEIRSGSKVFADGDYELVKEQEGLICYKRVKDGEEVYIYNNLSDSVYKPSDLGLTKSVTSLLTGEPVTEIGVKKFDIFR
jgi:glycosidase